MPNTGLKREQYRRDFSCRVPSIETRLAQIDQKTQGFSKAHYSIKINMLTYGFPFWENPQTTTEFGGLPYCEGSTKVFLNITQWMATTNTTATRGLSGTRRLCLSSLLASNALSPERLPLLI